MSAILEARKLGKSFQVGSSLLQVLDGIDLTVKRGEFLAVVGPSGAGKSTLLNLLGALDTPTSGRVLIDGDDTESLSSDALASIRKKRLGFVFQFFNLIPSLTALENILVPTLFDQEKPYVRAEELIRAVGLEGRSQHRPSELSGGEQQRVAIARALIHDPPIILADEPTGNLDSKTGAGILEIFSNLNKRGKTIVMATHEKGVSGIAHRVASLKDGKVVSMEKGKKEMGSTHEINSV